MKPWRERIAEAEQRREFFGLIRWPRFTDADQAAWTNPRHCLMGEVASAYYAVDDPHWWELFSALSGLRKSGEVCHALHTGDVRFISAYLDDLEARALEFKRAHSGTGR